MRVGERVAIDSQGQVGDEPVVGVDEAQLRDGSTPSSSRTMRLDRRGVSCDLGSHRLLVERLEVRLHRRDLGNRALDRALDLLGDRVCLLQREVARQLEVERELGAAVDRENR